MPWLWCRRRPESDDEANVPIGGQQREPRQAQEMKGITLNTQVPKLSDEQRAARDKALAKYRRRLEREERRKKQEQERAAREQARLSKMRAALDDPNANFGNDDLDSEDGAASVRTNSTLATTITQTTATATVASSRAVYGRGAYVPVDDGEEVVEVDDGTASVGVRSATSLNSRGVRGVFSPTGGGAGKDAGYAKYRRRRQRRRHPNEDEEAAAEELFNQWATDASDSDDADMHGDYDDDDNASFASSAPRPPEEVLATGGLVNGSGAHINGGSSNTRPLGTSGNPAAIEEDRAFAAGKGTSRPPDEHQQGPSPQHLKGQQPSTSQGTPTPGRSPHAAATNRHADPARSVSNGNIEGMLPPSQHQQAPAGSGAKKKKWTGKDVEMNVAMSGFFASADGSGLPPPSTTSPYASPSLPVPEEPQPAAKRKPNVTAVPSTGPNGHRKPNESVTQSTVSSGNRSNSPAGFQDE